MVSILCFACRWGCPACQPSSWCPRGTCAHRKAFGLSLFYGDSICNLCRSQSFQSYPEWTLYLCLSCYRLGTKVVSWRRAWSRSWHRLYGPGPREVAQECQACLRLQRVHMTFQSVVCHIRLFGNMARPWCMRDYSFGFQSSAYLLKSNRGSDSHLLLLYIRHRKRSIRWRDPGSCGPNTCEKWRISSRTKCSQKRHSLQKRLLFRLGCQVLGRFPLREDGGFSISLNATETLAFLKRTIDRNRIHTSICSDTLSVGAWSTTTRANTVQTI